MIAAFPDSIVAESDHDDDSYWFADHPKRRFRAKEDRQGRLWLVRRVLQGGDADVFLRTPVARRPIDSEFTIGVAWFQTALRVSPEHALKATRKIMRGVRR
jgi:hypothetical protein